MSTFTQTRDKVVDALGATAHPLSWLLLVAECLTTAGLALTGVAVAARWTPWGWLATAGAAGWLAALATDRCRPLAVRAVFAWW